MRYATSADYVCLSVAACVSDPEMWLRLGGYGFCLLKSRAVLLDRMRWKAPEQTAGLPHHDSEITYRASQQDLAAMLELGQTRKWRAIRGESALHTR